MILLLNYLSSNKVNWQKGIEQINDLIFLKKHDKSKISKSISTNIFDWIVENYDSKLFEGFTGSWTSGDTEKEEIVNTLNYTLNTLFQIKPQVDITSFLTTKLRTVNNEFERYMLEDSLEAIEVNKLSSNDEISDKTLDKILNRTDNYFQKEFNENKNSNLLCGLRNTIKEHDLSYSIGYCLKEEKFLSPFKKSSFIGSGPLFLSKATAHIEMSGSYPMTDWVEWFEMKIQNLEAYWILEIEFVKKKLSALKTILNKNTPELLKLLSNPNRISLEDELWRLEVIKEDLDKIQINNTILKKTREKK
jgi:hypothetical protein